MSTILEKARALTIGIKPKPITSAQLAVRVRVAEQSIADLESRHATVSLQWATDSSSGRELHKLEGDRAAARRDLRALRAARAGAGENEQAGERARAASLHASRVHSMTMHLRAGEKFAAALADALTKAAEARRG